MSNTSLTNMRQKTPAADLVNTMDSWYCDVLINCGGGRKKLPPHESNAMPHEQMDELQVSSYVHLDLREVRKLASRGGIPCRKIGGKFVFNKGEIDHWIETHMHLLGKDRLAGIERGVSEHHGYETGELLVAGLIPNGGLAAPLSARTGSAVLRALVDLADKADLVYARDELLREVAEREELCSTALWPGVALPHPRHPLPYDIAASFVVAGLTPNGIPYGCPDGSLSRLFFLICSKDERTHLHVLARLAQMLHNQSDIDKLMAAETPDDLRDTLTQLEHSVLNADDK